ncbi:hypothetical protein DPMN_174844 [Dreissena polymorpha]|uniref:C2H2-type domain-containing protein n=1 Tax=Dreissena polymorpha TaxID=45954 RepID=A0A9D4II70_DREPO|nr:hypothetical protein DPMN_174844 [Dreissena polymorpha]
MSDGPCKPDEEVSLTEGGIQRAGRARICKQCKFTTRDVRAFSNHRLHAHAEENSEDNCKTVTRKNSLRRKSSAACEKIASMEEQMEVTSEDRSASAANAVDTYPKSENITKLEQTTDMTSDQISPELLSSLALAPRKSFGSEKSKNNTMDKVNRHFEEALTDSRDDEHDDEDRLVIADGSDNEADSPDDHVPSRSGNIQNRNYLCENCDFTSNSAKAYLRHHVDVHNSGIVIYECDICDYATKYKQKLPRHRKLHFSGKDGPDESDLENKFAEGELKGTAENNGMTSINMELMNGEEDMDDGIEADEDDEEEMVALSAHDGHNLTAGSTPMEAKKKRIRQEVDPLKYYEVMDEVGVKYACSKCGNVYKWRKSLNKHWKEKHCGEIPDLTKPPATLQNYTLYCRYKTKFGGPPPAAPNVVYGAATASPANQMKAHRATPTSNHSESGRVKDEPQIHQTPTLSNVVMPRQIGPFIAGTTVNSGPLFSPVNRSNHTNHMTPRSRAADSHHEMRHVVNSMQVQSGGNQSQKQFMPHEVFQQQKLLPKPMQQNQQSEPLDFSKKSSEASGKSEPSWPDTNSESDSLTEMPISLMVSQANSQIAAAMKHGQEMNDSIEASTLRCGKCNYIAKTLADYSSHMALHLNKRAFKCAECGSHFTGIDELNKHFMDYHSEKIQEHKEAIQKIPHGLQQTYHLLKMPLDSISGLSSQELMSNEPKQLKCSMCSFVAKWPAELQKHAVSHSEERPFVCMVCGSTYKWKWDLVKHFEKSHSTLPNPYKRREGGGVMASNSPATPPPDMIAMGKSQANLMDMSAMSSNYNDEEVYSAGNKRRLSESESWDAEHYLREYLERQARDRKEMGQLELHSHLLMQARGAFSDPVKRVKVENHDIEDYDNQTPKRIVHEALKERLNSGNIKHEELTPSKDKLSDKKDAKGEVVLPYKCTVCEYRARWPSEISQHMKNHSTEKPYHCPRCSYKSKWKWDVVKHLRRCGGGTVHDVIDTTKMKKMAPPNIMVLPMGHSGQQNGSQTLNQPKASLSQSVFPGGQRYSSLSPAMNLPMSTVSKSLANNFNILSGNKDHQEAMDVSSDPAKQPVFRSLVNQGFHHCLECQFIGNSPTELKRHSLLHSENKPFNCNDCGYSTRWKCDLKKHIKNYGHQNTSITLDDDEDGGDEENENDNSMEQFTELSEDSDEDQSTLYMCPQCPYNSYKKKAYDLHLKIHGGWSNAVDEVSETSSPLKESKYKCSKCDYHGNDLSSFLHHKRSHNFEEVSNGRSQDSPVPSEVSSRTLHLKHRRKPVKQFKCDRCPYVCFKKSALHVHDAMHIPRGTDTFLCMFCDYNVFSKTLLLQHMRLHPDYNPAECSEADSKITSVELEEIERLEEAEINSDDSRSLEENNNDGEASDRVLDFSCPNSSRTTTPVNGPVEQSVKQQVSPTNNNSLIGNMNNNEKTSPSSGMNLPCEWCSATFPNVVALYHHSRSLHPNQLKAQEAGDIAARQAPSKGMQLEQIVRERQKEYQVYHHQVTSLSPSIVLPFQHAPSTSNAQSLLNKLVPLAPKPSSFQQSPGQQTSPQSLQLDQSERARKSITQQKKSRSFQCTKCTFTAPNAVTYLRHIERHGSNCKHTCLFCDYSIDRLNLLYQHMKGTHGAQWAGSPEEKISHVVLGEDSNNNLIDEMNDEQAEDMIGESLDMDVEGNDAERGVLFAYQEKGIVPKLVLLEESVWRGIPLSICSLEGKRHFKCPKCMYINANAANTANHFQQHGQNRRFRCHQCDYSVDNPKTMQHHLESIHPKEPNYTLVKSAKKPEAVAAPALHSCPKCPYKTTEKVKLAIHMERHSGTGRFDCQLCDYKVDQYGHLRQHARLHKKAITSLVSADEAMFTTERSFEDQEFAKRWNDNNPVDQLNRSDSRVCFKCSQCPFFTFKKEKILKHRLCHISKGPYACQDCSFSTNFTNDLEEHVQYHSTLQAPSDQALEFVLDPFSELYKVLEKFPDDLKADNCMENLEEDYTMDIDNDMEDDEEAALMEEELRDTVGGALDMDVRDRNGKEF